MIVLEVGSAVGSTWDQLVLACDLTRTESGPESFLKCDSMCGMLILNCTIALAQKTLVEITDLNGINMHPQLFVNHSMVSSDFILKRFLSIEVILFLPQLHNLIYPHIG